MENLRLLLFTTLWTAIWAAPLPKLSRRVELVAGLIPFAAFGLRVFGACFIGVPADDPVRMAVAPLVDWINGSSGTVPFQWVLDVTVAIGLVWFASIANISRRWRLATIWVMPAVALASLGLALAPESDHRLRQNTKAKAATRRPRPGVVAGERLRAAGRVAHYAVMRRSPARSSACSGRRPTGAPAGRP